MLPFRCEGRCDKPLSGEQGDQGDGRSWRDQALSELSENVNKSRTSPIFRSSRPIFPIFRYMLWEKALTYMAPCFYTRCHRKGVLIIDFGKRMESIPESRLGEP